MPSSSDRLDDTAYKQLEHSHFTLGHSAASFEVSSC